MRVAIDVDSTGDRPTGIGRYASGLVEGLRAAAPEHEFVLLRRRHAGVMRVDRRLRWQQGGVPRRAWAARADLLHVTGFDAPLLRSCPVVLTVHDLLGLRFPETLPIAARAYWSRWLPFTIRFADAVIAVSEATRKNLSDLLHVSGDHVHVVHSGVDARFRPQPAEAVRSLRARYDLARPYILFVSTLEPRKGIDTLLAAFERIAPHHPHDLVLAGKQGWGSDPGGCRELRHRVRHLDYVPDGDLPSLYAGAHLLVLPSRGEGFGFPVLEAMACGTPVVCAEVASLSEIAGDAARLVPVDDPLALSRAMGEVLSSSELAASLRERGLRNAGRFTWERAARQTLSVYEETLNRSARPKR